MRIAAYRLLEARPAAIDGTSRGRRRRGMLEDIPAYLDGGGMWVSDRVESSGRHSFIMSSTNQVPGIHDHVRDCPHGT